MIFGRCLQPAGILEVSGRVKPIMPNAASMCLHVPQRAPRDQGLQPGTLGLGLRPKQAIQGRVLKLLIVPDPFYNPIGPITIAHFKEPVNPAQNP